MNTDYIVIGQLSAAAICLVLISVYLNHLLANSRDKVRDRREQSLVLIQAFESDLSALLQSNNDCRLILNEAAYHRHDAAVRIFSRHLSWFDKFRFNTIWHRLAMIRISKKHQIPFYTQYSDCGSLDKRAIMRPLAIKRIQDIIFFASKNI